MLETAIGARYRRYQRAVGLLILAMLGVLFALLWMANRQLGFFSQTYRLHGFLDNVRNLRQTTPVTLAGLNLLFLLVPLWRRYGQQLARGWRWRQSGLESPLFWTPFAVLVLLLARLLLI